MRVDEIGSKYKDLCGYLANECANKVRKFFELLIGGKYLQCVGVS